MPEGRERLPEGRGNQRRGRACTRRQLSRSDRRVDASAGLLADLSARRFVCRGRYGKRMVDGGEVEGEGEGRDGYMWQDVCGRQGGSEGGLYVVGETGCMRRRSRVGCGRG